MISQARSADFDVASTAVSALSRANSQASFDELLKVAKDQRSPMAQSAVVALNYRLATATYAPELAADRDRIRAALPTLCAGHYRQEIAQFCGEQR